MSFLPKQKMGVFTCFFVVFTVRFVETFLFYTTSRHFGKRKKETKKNILRRVSQMLGTEESGAS